MRGHYKSWSGMKKRAESLVCATLKGRIAYFYTAYHTVHNAYGRAAVRLDGKDAVCFSWIETYRQERDIAEFLSSRPVPSLEGPGDEFYEKQKPVWDANCIYCHWDFLDALHRFLSLPIEDALASDDFIVKIFAIVDRRVGRRRLESIKAAGEYEGYPDWVKMFYTLRFEAEGLGGDGSGK